MRLNCLFLLAIVLSSTSCSINHSIHFKKDNTVVIDTDYDEELESKIQKSTIANQFSLDSTNFRMTFNIDIIDSIGYFLPIHNPGYLTFKDSGDSILVKSGTVNPYDSEPKFCCHLELRITSEKSMIGFDSKGKKIKYKNGKHNGFWVSQSLRQQLKKKKNIKMTLINKHSPPHAL